jgi:hypothetical protein
MKMPIPSAADQKTFERMAGKVAEARALQRQSIEDLDRLIPAMLDQIF